MRESIEKLSFNFDEYGKKKTILHCLYCRKQWAGIRRLSVQRREGTREPDKFREFEAATPLEGTYYHETVVCQGCLNKVPNLYILQDKEPMLQKAEDMKQDMEDYHMLDKYVRQYLASLSMERVGELASRSSPPGDLTQKTSILKRRLISAVINSFEDSLARCSVLIGFIPMLMGTGGNSGNQSSVAVIRGLSLNEISFGDLLEVVWKESRVAVVCGILLACGNFVKLLVVDRGLMQNTEVTPLVALVICLTLVCTVFCAKVVGCMLPLLAEKIGLDPAVMAAPFISTIVDVLSLVIYFAFATALLGL